MTRTLTLLALFYCSCTPASLPTDVVGDDTAVDTDAPEPPAPDSGEAVVVVTDTAVEGVTNGEAMPVFSPDGGGFVSETKVSLSSSTGAGSLVYCQGEPDRMCDLEPYKGPITLNGSGILYARVDDGTETVGVVEARSFVELDSAVAAFTSELAVMVFWTNGESADDSNPVAMGLDVFESASDLTASSSSSGRARLKVRGSSSYGTAKLSYDMELWAADSDADRREPLLGMPEEGDWVLYAPYYYDQALIRNSLGYQLSHDIGRYAPRTKFVELFVAEYGQPVSMTDYDGLYVITEEIERGTNRVDVTEIGPDDNALPAVTGGYVIKRDRAGSNESGFWPGQAGGAFSFNYPMVWVDPEEDERTDAQQDYISGLLDDFAAALIAADHTSPTSGLHYSEIVDVGSWIDHHILNILFKNPDAFRLSGYMHKDREGLLHAGPLWDLDRTAGGNDSRCTDPLLWDASNITSDMTPAFTWGWYGGLFDDPDFREQYFSRLSSLLENELSKDAILTHIDEMEQTIGAAGGRNTARWGTADFSGQISALRSWFGQRHDWMTACLDEEPDPRDCR